MVNKEQKFRRVRRLFFAINIPDDIRLELVKYQKQWRRCPVRWTKPENLHFTVLFLGTVDDERLAILRRKAKELLRDFQPFAVRLTEIALGPPQRLPTMAWAIAETDPEPAAADLAAILLRAARAAGVDPPNADRRFHLHLTLGRAKGPHLKGTSIAANLGATFVAEHIDLMESTLTPEDPDYRLIESLPSAV